MNDPGFQAEWRCTVESFFGAGSIVLDLSGARPAWRAGNKMWDAYQHVKTTRAIYQKGYRYAGVMRHAWESGIAIVRADALAYAEGEAVGGGYGIVANTTAGWSWGDAVGFVPLPGFGVASAAISIAGAC